MSALTNLLPVTTAPVTLSSAPRTVTHNAEAAAGIDKPARERAARDAVQNGADEQEEASAFAEVYEGELQEQRQTAPVVRVSLSSTTSTFEIAMIVPEHLEVPAQTPHADGGNPLPLTGETLPPLSGDAGPGKVNVPASSSISDAIILQGTPVSGAAEAPVVATQTQAPEQHTVQTQTLQAQAQTTTAAIDVGMSAPVEALAFAAGLADADIPPVPMLSQSGQAIGIEANPAQILVSAVPNSEMTNDVHSLPGRSAETANALVSAAAAVSGMEIPVDVPSELSAKESTQSVTAHAVPSQLPTEEVIFLEQIAARITDADSIPAASPVTEQAKDTVWQSQVADRVRAWRGLAGGESATNLATSVTSTQGRHEFAMTGSLGGQLQQFAESLRIAVNNPSPAASAEGASSTTNVDATGAWRGDSGASAVQQSAGRMVTPGPTFQQTLSQNMQASSFGQPLGQSFGEKSWAESLSQRITLMAGQKVSSASIELDPPELGAMTVKITVTGDQASVNFASPNALVRDALEQTFSRLQDLLGQQGLQLADANVSDNSARGRNSGESGSGGGNRGTQTDSEIDTGATTHTVKAPLGLIDFYA
ncbi:MAG: flagellar hook-length control protein FliK [Gammaproteobacteria bacterium]|nr:flagellar hook-length control protein FliK [Gammaproteobacteria bacterium]